MSQMLSVPDNVRCEMWFFIEPSNSFSVPGVSTRYIKHPVIDHAVVVVDDVGKVAPHVGQPVGLIFAFRYKEDTGIFVYTLKHILAYLNGAKHVDEDASQMGALCKGRCSDGGCASV